MSLIRMQMTCWHFATALPPTGQHRQEIAQPERSLCDARHGLSPMAIHEGNDIAREVVRVARSNADDPAPGNPNNHHMIGKPTLQT